MVTQIDSKVDHRDHVEPLLSPQPEALAVDPL